MKTLIPLVAIALFASGCSTIDVSHRHDDGEDFTRFLYYAWMPNHYHFMLEALTNGNLSAMMKIIDQKYSIWHKNKYGGQGQLWQGRFKNKLITSEIHFAICASYIELNPVKDRLCTKPEEYLWTSYHGHTVSPNDILLDFDHQYLSLGSNTHERHKAHKKNIELRMCLGSLSNYQHESSLVEYE